MTSKTLRHRRLMVTSRPIILMMWWMKLTVGMRRAPFLYTQMGCWMIPLLRTIWWLEWHQKLPQLTFAQWIRKRRELTLSISSMRSTVSEVLTTEPRRILTVSAWSSAASSQTIGLDFRHSSAYVDTLTQETMSRTPKLRTSTWWSLFYSKGESLRQSKRWKFWYRRRRNPRTRSWARPSKRTSRRTSMRPCLMIKSDRYKEKVPNQRPTTCAKLWPKLSKKNLNTSWFAEKIMISNNLIIKIIKRI